MISTWGRIDAPWDSIIAWIAAEEPSLPPILLLQNGSRFRTLPPSDAIGLDTLAFGKRPILGTNLRQAIRPVALSATSPDETEPIESFIDLAGDQRLVARITAPSIKTATSTGALTVSPAEIREWLDITEDRSEPADASGQQWQRLELWGGGIVTGRIQDSSIKVEAANLRWALPVSDIRRFSNPIPRIEESVMRRVAELIRDLGHAEWNVRQAASSELQDLGPLARGSLREALRHTADPEVVRRIEQLLQSEP